MSKHKVFWTKQAVTDLKEIINYIEEDNISAAVKTKKNIQSLCDKLNSNPEKYRIIPELKEIGVNSYREIIYKPYRILFKLTEKNIYIFAVIDSRRDLEYFLFKRMIRL